MDSTGAPWPIAERNGGLLDNIYVPGTAPQQAIEIPPTVGTNEQVMSELGPGELQITGATAPFTCTGPGVTPTTSSSDVSVAVSAGQTVTVTCTVDAS